MGLHIAHVNRYKLLSVPVSCKKDVVEDIKPIKQSLKGQEKKRRIYNSSCMSASSPSPTTALAALLTASAAPEAADLTEEAAPELALEADLDALEAPDVADLEAS